MDFKFYKLVKNNICIYVGMTTNKYLSNRMANHKQNFKDWLIGKKRKLFYMTEDFSFDDVKIELIEECYYENVQEAREQENYYIEKLNPTQTQNKLLNPNYQKEYQKEWAKNNPDKVKAKTDKYNKKIYQCINCDLYVTQCNKTRHDTTCNANAMIYNTKNRFRVRQCGKNACEIGTFKTLEEAKAARKDYLDKQQLNNI